MAAGQQKKVLTNSNSLEQNSRKKKKKLDFSDHVLNLRPQIHLEWDDCLKMAVPRRALIGITWKDLAPFIDCPPHCASDLADVLTVPEEIFDLQNLKDVLSYEVWAMCLSESERKLLTQFLPVGTAAEHAVHSLLVGRNHHFGNPFIEWSTSLCSGYFHPDNVLRMEKQSMANKRAYYAQLRSYHVDLLEILKQWKERWLNCMDPKVLWNYNNESATRKQESSPLSSEKNKAHLSWKGDIQEVCIDENNVVKYMSYIKIGKKQLELVKSLKQSADGIQLRLLSSVLGDVKGFHVEPYTKFEEEEKKRLNVHWLRLAKFDVQLAFDGWRRRNLLRVEWGKTLDLELEKRKSVVYMDDGESESIHEEHTKNEESEHNSDVEMLEQEPDSVSESMCDHFLEGSIPLNHHQELGTSFLDHRLDCQQQQLDENCPKSNTNNHYAERIPSLNYQHQLSSPNSLPDLEFDGRNSDRVGVKSAENSPVFAQFVGKTDAVEGVLEPKMPASSTKEGIWLSVGQQGSFYNEPTTPDHQYVDLEGKENNNGLPFIPFSSPPTELLMPFGSRIPISYPRSSNQPGLQFLMASDDFPDSTRLVEQFPDPHRSINKDYSVGRYLIQGNFPPTGPHCLPAMSSSSSSSLCGGALMNKNWLSENHRPLNSWRIGGDIDSSVIGGNQYLEDSSLFSVLSECRILPPCSSIEDARPDGQFLQGRGFLGDGMSRPDGNIYTSISHNVYKGATSSYQPSSANQVSLNNSQWMNFSQQSPRPWNR